MARLYGFGKSSYTSSFKVRDEDKFKQWIDSFGDGEYGIMREELLVEENSKEHGKLYALDFDICEGEIPEYRYDYEADEEADEESDIEIYEEIQPHLADGWSVVFISVGGWAVVVTQTEVEDISLYDAVRTKLEQLGNPLCPTIQEVA